VDSLESTGGSKPTEYNPGLFEFPPGDGRAVVASFDGSAITSDAGSLAGPDRPGDPADRAVRSLLRRHAQRARWLIERVVHVRGSTARPGRTARQEPAKVWGQARRRRRPPFSSRPRGHPSRHSPCSSYSMSCVTGFGRSTAVKFMRCCNKSRDSPQETRNPANQTAKIRRSDPRRRRRRRPQGINPNRRGDTNNIQRALACCPWSEPLN
jgi:hypothetical protein